MRHYQSDSPRAAARIVSLSLLADGGLDRRELAYLREENVYARLGLSEHEFDQVMREFCEDLLQCSHYWDAGRLRLAPEVLEALLDDIRLVERQGPLLRMMFEIVSADGQLTREEALLLQRAMARWGVDLPVA